MAAADAPLSIIFICIGNSDFSPLQKICRKKEGKRDCTEVVIVSEILEGSDIVSENKARMAAQSLHLIPAQMVSYMHNNNIAAKPPIQVAFENQLRRFFVPGLPFSIVPFIFVDP